MALHWKHIKGMNGSSPLYTYIEFKGQDTTVDSNSLKKGQNPKIYVSYKNYDASADLSAAAATSLGSIITSETKGQAITNEIQLRGGLKADIIKSLRSSSTTITLSSSGVSISKPTAVTGDFTTDSKLIGKTLDITNNAAVGGDAKITGSCEALFFNALSDRRAKDNIKPFNQKALDIISKLQTYTYNYINNKQQSYGIMAQDLLNVDINGFSFVENSTASGQTGDFMTIKEDKLVYLLLEGIKEQQEEINQLRLQVEELKNECITH